MEAQKVPRRLKNSLNRIPLLSTFSDSDYQLLIKELKYEEVPKDRVLFQKGDPGDKLFIIDKGGVKICSYTEKGDEFIYAVLGSGDFFGEMALIDGLPRSADAITTMDSAFYVLHKRDFLNILKSNFHLVEAILQALSKRVRELNEMVIDASYTNVMERLAKRLVRMVEENESELNEKGEIVITHSQPYLASIIGTTRESINRRLRELRQKGIVSTPKKNVIVIHDFNSLKAIAGVYEIERLGI